MITMSAYCSAPDENVKDFREPGLLYIEDLGRLAESVLVLSSRSTLPQKSASSTFFEGICALSLNFGWRLR